MAAKAKQPAIVAELGRPETPSETAARKAEASRLYKERKTVNNLVLSLIVSLALMLVLVLIVPRGVDQWSGHEVNVAEAAELNTPSAGLPLVAPEMPDNWMAKRAALQGEKNSDIVQWRINYNIENNSVLTYAAVVQAFTVTGADVNETWIAQQLEAQNATGVATIGGVEWTVYDHQNRSADESNMLYGLQAQVGATTLLVYGTAGADTIRALANEVAEQAAKLDLASATAGGAGGAPNNSETAPNREAS